MEKEWLNCGQVTTPNCADFKLPPRLGTLVVGEAGETGETGGKVYCFDGGGIIKSGCVATRVI